MICVPLKKIGDVNLNAFNAITRKDKSKTLTKHISYKCKCKFDGTKYNLNQKFNNDNSQYECKNLRKHHVYERDYIWNPSTCMCENEITLYYQ